MIDGTTLSARFVTLTMGAVLAAWAVLTLQSQLSTGALNQAAMRIMAGETLRPDVAARALQEADLIDRAPHATAGLIRAAALMRVRAAEDEVNLRHVIADNPVFAAAETTVRAALEVAPTDAFLWFALAWLGKTRDGARAAQLPWLAWSYHTGPEEGWLALHRNALAVTLLPALPPPLAAATGAEFRNLVASHYTDAAAEILAGPGWPQHETLLASLTPLSQEMRAGFAQTLLRRGVDVQVPGVVRRRDRPWR